MTDETKKPDIAAIRELAAKWHDEYGSAPLTNDPRARAANTIDSLLAERDTLTAELARSTAQLQDHICARCLETLTADCLEADMGRRYLRSAEERDRIRAALARVTAERDSAWEQAATHVEAHCCVSTCCDAQPGGNEAKALAECVRDYGRRLAALGKGGAK